MLNRLRGFFAASLRQSWHVYLAVLTVFVSGVAAGVYGVEKMGAEQMQELGGYVARFLQQAGLIEVDYQAVLKSALYNDLIVILAVYALGLTVIGIPVMLGIIFLRGFTLGFAVSFLAGQKNLQGIILVCAAVLPQNLLFVPALLMGGVASLSFAIILARRFFNSRVAVWPGFVAYSGLTVLIAACSACAGLVEVYFTPLAVKLAAGYFF